MSALIRLIAVAGAGALGYSQVSKIGEKPKEGFNGLGVGVAVAAGAVSYVIARKVL